MGKMSYAMIFVFVVELALYLFGGPAASTTWFNFLFNIGNYLTNPIFLLVTGSLAVVSIASIIPGTFAFFNIYSMYARIAAVLILFISPIVSLYIFLNSQLSALGGGIADSAQIISSFLVAPLIIWFIFATLDWVRGTDN